MTFGAAKIATISTALAAALAACIGATLAPAPVWAAPGEVLATVADGSSPHRVVKVADGLDFPWSIAFLPSGDLLVTEREGGLRRIDAAGTLHPVAHELPVTAIRQGGLMDVLLAPDFAETGRLHICYATGPDDANFNEVATARLVGDALIEATVVWTADSAAERGFHYGCRLVQRDDGTLFITLGDRGGHREKSQDPFNHFGTTVRIAPDGSIPADNPFADGVGGRPDVWSYGHRNQQGAALHPTTRELWTHEHGARGGDEVNIVRPGVNHGWPATTHGINYDGSTISEHTSLPGIVDPVKVWVPSIAPSGLAFYEGSAFPASAFPAWSGDLFVGALAGSALHRLEVTETGVTNEEVLLADLGVRIRDVRVGPDGFIYIATDLPADEGAILRIEPLPTPAQ